ncbi:ribosomal protein S3, C-terminal domain-containing protein [Pavlovales sp. CCMP2436]|nr:ribosomal protein S3, C-terminal domain-containing protein [Pavlovales sp. CCMP2436]
MLALRRLSCRGLSSAVQDASSVGRLMPIVEAEDYFVSKIVGNHLRRPRSISVPLELARGAEAADPTTEGVVVPRTRVKATKMQSTPDARPPYFEPDTVRVKILQPQKGVVSSWPAHDFQEMIGDMKRTIGRNAGLPMENVRFRVNVVPISIDTKECITSPTRPNTPPASLIGHYCCETIENGKLRELGSKRGVSMLVKEIYAAYGPHTGRRRYIKGVRVLISGRLGQERASQASAAEGTLPLSTLDADVDYVSRRAQTRSGIVGVKVWVVTDGVPGMKQPGAAATDPFFM